MKIELQPPESPVATKIDLRVLVAEICRRAKKDSVLTADEEKRARALCGEYVKLLPCLFANPRKQANADFLDQQRKIGSGAPVQDAFQRGELESEVRTRTHAEKERMVAITTEATALLEVITQRFTKILDGVIEKIEAEQRAEYAVFGISNYQASLLLQCLADIGRRLDNMIPTAGARSDVVSMFQPFVSDLPKKPEPPESDEMRLARKAATVAEANAAKLRAKADTKSAEERAAKAEHDARFAEKERRKREMAEQGLIRLSASK